MWCDVKDKVEAAVGDWNWKIIFLYLTVIILFIVVAYQTYYKYIVPRLDPDFVPNKEFHYNLRPSKRKYKSTPGSGSGEGKDDEDETAELMFFCVKWCPHCKKAEPEWQKVVDKFTGKKIGKTWIYFHKIDCEDDEDLAEEYKISGYPTIKLIKKDQVVEYNAKPIATTLEEFLRTTL
jgi:thiol-disulfide isomerase/thioredoxin